MKDAKKMLERAWLWREERGVFSETSAVRVFHGPGEGEGEWRNLAIDRFGDQYWVTEWEREGAKSSGGGMSARVQSEICEFLNARGAKGVVLLGRPQQGIPNEPKLLVGRADDQRFEVQERGAKYWIQMMGARHPGLFLDHAPLRVWLRARCRGLRVLNTFSYTGSLSVASGLGGASHVTTLDLAKPVIRWAQDNWELNGLPLESARFIAGDVFEWLPRLKREDRKYDLVILDPPSFSHGNKGRFSTSKDLEKLHGHAMDILAPGGMIVTSINSANVAWAKYEADVSAAARARGLRFEVLSRIDMPDTFPTRLGEPLERYLKGFILRSL